MSLSSTRTFGLDVKTLTNSEVFVTVINPAFKKKEQQKKKGPDF